MTEEEMLDIAEKVNLVSLDKDGIRNWKVSPSIILNYARVIYEQGYGEGYEEGYGRGYDVGEEIGYDRGTLDGE